MAKRKSKPVASESRLFVLALGLLVGFVIAFVLLLSRLPVDSVISQYNDDATRGAEVAEMNFDYPAVLQAQKAARKPAAEQVETPVVFIEPPTLNQLQSEQVPATPAIATRPVPQPPADQPSMKPDVQTPQPQIQTPPPPAILSKPDAQPRLREPVREMLASNTAQDSFFVEAGNYQDNNDALNAQISLRGLGLEAFIVVRQDNLGRFGHRVRIGPFFEQSRLDTTLARLRASGIAAKLIRVKG